MIRSVLVFELYALFLRFDIAITIKSTLNQIFAAREKISLFICIDLRSLYEYLVKLNITQKKQLIIDILYLKQLYKRRKIVEIL